MALQFVLYRNASLLCRITHAALQAGTTVPRLAKSAGYTHLAFPKKQMSRLASPAYLSPAAAMPKQGYDYFLVLDFEATCSAEKGVPTPQEIIEFPVLKVNGQTFETESTFHSYVQPQAHPQLTSFCTELTGIVQDMVDDQPHLQEVLSRFDDWMQKEGLLQAPLTVCLPWHTCTALHDSMDQLEKGVRRVHGPLAQDPVGCTALL